MMEQINVSGEEIWRSQLQLRADKGEQKWVYTH